MKRGHIVGHLHNHPVGIPRLDFGDEVKVRYDHVIDIDWHDSPQAHSGAGAMDTPAATEAAHEDRL